MFERFQGVEGPRRSNVTRRDLHEMLMIRLLSILTGGRTCVDMAAFGRVWEPRLDVAAVGGKALRRSCEDATERSPLPLVRAFAAEANDLRIAEGEKAGRV